MSILMLSAKGFCYIILADGRKSKCWVGFFPSCLGLSCSCLRAKVWNAKSTCILLSFHSSNCNHKMTSYDINIFVQARRASATRTREGALHVSIQRDPEQSNSTKMRRGSGEHDRVPRKNMAISKENSDDSDGRCDSLRICSPRTCPRRRSGEHSPHTSQVRATRRPAHHYGTVTGKK